MSNCRERFDSENEKARLNFLMTTESRYLNCVHQFKRFRNLTNTKRHVNVYGRKACIQYQIFTLFHNHDKQRKEKDSKDDTMLVCVL